MRIVMLGAPGAGKGTQCKILSEKYDLLHLSSGDILRKERAEGTDLGKQAQQYMDSGQLVPDELIVKMMASAMNDAPQGGWMLDGFPRTVNQAAELDKYLDSKGENIDVVFNLVVNDETVMKRITGRRSCPQCGAVYHVDNKPPKKDTVCDNDEVELTQRPDDIPEVIENRLATYYKQTEPVVNYYQKNSSVVELDANKDADDVALEMFEKLDSLAK